MNRLKDLRMRELEFSQQEHALIRQSFLELQRSHNLSVAGHRPQIDPDFGPNSCRSLYVGNIHILVTEPLLKNFFANICPVQACQLIRKGKSTYGFIHYFDQPAASTAISSLNGKEMFGQPIKVNWAYPYRQREDTSELYKVFVGDLGGEVTDEMLLEFFSEYPSCSEARVIWDQNTGRSRGFGLVSFRNQQDALIAMNDSTGKRLGSRRIRCDWATLLAGAHEDKYVLDGRREELLDGSPEDGKDMSSGEASENDPRHTTVYVDNLGPEDLYFHFQAPRAGVIDDVIIHRDKGFGFVRYNSHSEAALVIPMENNRSILYGRQIKGSSGRMPTLTGKTSNPFEVPTAASASTSSPLPTVALDSISDALPTTVSASTSDPQLTTASASDALPTLASALDVRPAAASASVSNALPAAASASNALRTTVLVLDPPNAAASGSASDALTTAASPSDALPSIASASEALPIAASASALDALPTTASTSDALPATALASALDALPPTASASDALPATALASALDALPTTASVSDALRTPTSTSDARPAVASASDALLAVASASVSVSDALPTPASVSDPLDATALASDADTLPLAVSVSDELRGTVSGATSDALPTAASASDALPTTASTSDTLPTKASASDALPPAALASALNALPTTTSASFPSNLAFDLLAQDWPLLKRQMGGAKSLKRPQMQRAQKQARATAAVAGQATQDGKSTAATAAPHRK